MSPKSGLVWQAVHYPHPLEPDHVVGLLRLWGADQRSPVIALEVRGQGGTASFAVGAHRDRTAVIANQIRQVIPGAQLSPDGDRPAMRMAVHLKLNTRHRPLLTDDADSAARAILGAIAAARGTEHLVLQIVLGPRRRPLAVPTNSPAALTDPWYTVAWYGNGPTLDGDKRTALRTKVSQHGFACTIRLGAQAASDKRARSLILSLFASIRRSEGAGVHFRLKPESVVKLMTAQLPLRWPLRLGASEVAAVSGLPMGQSDLPGVRSLHPRQLAPHRSLRAGDGPLIMATAPGFERRALGLTADDARHHSWYIGKTGAGKSNLLLLSIIGAMRAGHSVFVQDPKGDLINDVLACVPKEREKDVVVLDPAEALSGGPGEVVGLNPLVPIGGDTELAVDGMLTVFKGLYPDAWGPRTNDVIAGAINTLCRRPDTSLVMLVLLLTNDGFRRSLVSSIDDPITLGPFWQWFESLSEASRQQAVLPALSRLRTLIMRPMMRAVLGQVSPRFDLQELVTQRKIVLVSLAKGLLGQDAASLLGSLIVSRLWQTILTRAAVPPAKRHPVFVYIDEVQNYLHIDTDIAELFAESRSYGVALHVAHQELGQLPRHIKSGLMANARSRVIFTVSEDDAREFARGTSDLVPEDFASLGRYEVYASLLSHGQNTPYASARTLPPPPKTSDPATIRRLSRERYARPLNEIEAGFAALFTPPADEPPLGRRPRRQP